MKIHTGIGADKRGAIPLKESFNQEGLTIIYALAARTFYQKGDLRP